MISRSDLGYQAIFDRLKTKAVAEWNAKLDEPYDRDVTGKCNLVPYTCRAGQTRRQCVPKACQEIGLTSDMVLGQMADKEYVDSKCAQYK